MTSFVDVCDVKSAVKPYVCLIVNNKTKMNMTCVSTMPWVTCGQEKGDLAKGVYFPRVNKSF